MGLKELILKGPALAGVPNAGRWSRINEVVWTEEAAGASVFAHSSEDADNEEGRLDVLFGWIGLAQDYNKAKYIRDLSSLVLLRHYINEHGRGDLRGRAAELEGHLIALEPYYPDVAKILTVEAAAQGFWT